MATTLSVTPTEVPVDTDTPLRYVGSGWDPDAILVVGLRSYTSQGVGEVAADGSFDVTIGSGALPAGAYHPFAQAGGDQKQTTLHAR
jgi:hypothetical protein